MKETTAQNTPCLSRILLSVCLLLTANTLEAQQANAPDPTPQAGNCTQKDASTRPECPSAIAFFEKLQEALKSDDHQAVASLVRYPLLTNHRGAHVSIKSRAELLRGFSQIFDPGLTCDILHTNSTEVWGNSHGFSIAGGEIWFDAVAPAQEKASSSAPDSEYPMKIISINHGQALYPCKTVHSVATP